MNARDSIRFHVYEPWLRLQTDLGMNLSARISSLCDLGKLPSPTEPAFLPLGDVGQLL